DRPVHPLAPGAQVDEVDAEDAFGAGFAHQAHLERRGEQLGEDGDDVDAHPGDATAPGGRVALPGNPGPAGSLPRCPAARFPHSSPRCSAWPPAPWGPATGTAARSHPPPARPPKGRPPPPPGPPP